MSSASATAAAGSLAAHHQISVRSAAISAVLSSTASAAVNLPIIYRTARQPEAFRKLVIVSATITAIGLIILATVLLLTR